MPRCLVNYENFKLLGNLREMFLRCMSARPCFRIISLRHIAIRFLSWRSWIISLDYRSNGIASGLGGSRAGIIQVKEGGHSSGISSWGRSGAAFSGRATLPALTFKENR